MINDELKKTNTVMLAILACLLWSSAFVGVKTGLKYSPPLFFAGLRFFTSGLILLPFMKYPEGWWSYLKQHWRFLWALGFIQTFLLYSLFYLGLAKVPGSVGAVIIGASPIFTAFMAHLLLTDDKLDFKKTLIISLGFSGIVVISLPGLLNIQNSFSLVGIGLLVTANIASNFGNIMVAKHRIKSSPIAINAWQLVFGGGMLLSLSLVEESPILLISDPIYWSSLLWLIIVSTGSLSIWYTLLRRKNVKVSELNIWKFIIPVLGALWSWLLLDDSSPDIYQISGICLIVSSIIGINILTKRRIKIQRAISLGSSE